jgi:hypothetical protein
MSYINISSRRNLCVFYYLLMFFFTRAATTNETMSAQLRFALLIFHFNFLTLFQLSARTGETFYLHIPLDVFSDISELNNDCPPDALFSLY